MRARPTPAQLAVARERHVPATAEQRRHVQAAARNPAMALAQNHGHPAVAATSHAAQFRGPGVVAAHPGRPISAVPPTAARAARSRSRHYKARARRSPAAGAAGSRAYAARSTALAGQWHRGGTLLEWAHIKRPRRTLHNDDTTFSRAHGRRATNRQNGGAHAAFADDGASSGLQTTAAFCRCATFCSPTSCCSATAFCRATAFAPQHRVLPRHRILPPHRQEARGAGRPAGTDKAVPTGGRSGC